MSRAIRQKRQVAWLFRVLSIGVTLMLLPPFIAVAVAPMVLFLVPVAILAIPFLIAAFQREPFAAQHDAHHGHRSARGASGLAPRRQHA